MRSEVYRQIAAIIKRDQKALKRMRGEQGSPPEEAMPISPDIKSEEEVDLSRELEDHDLNEMEYQAFEQTLIKSLRTLRVDANRLKTIG